MRTLFLEKTSLYSQIMKKKQFLCFFISLLSLTSLFADGLYLGSNSSCSPSLFLIGTTFDVCTNTYVGYTEDHSSRLEIHTDVSLDHLRGVYVENYGYSNTMSISNGIIGGVYEGFGVINYSTSSNNCVQVIGTNGSSNNFGDLNTQNPYLFNVMDIRIFNPMADNN
ncbi:MAG: hypothetical protein K2X08_00215, partial [Chlamydiales bacterium]|nr:hypothetical protein [Chlamydiales bacterium]